ncbi:MAG: hypothetical protein IJJ33_01025 [Victivallales bacterium]|nr:hypothetical protein [Victivallales bacterium]
MTRLLRQSLAGVALAVLLAGCFSLRIPYQPPVASLFPTVVPMRTLQGLKPRATTEAEISALLQRQGILKTLRNAGLRELTLKEVARGLSTRGYAEIDSRRAQCTVLWVSFALLPNGQIRMTHATTRKPLLPSDAPLEWTTTDSKGKPRRHRQWETDRTLLHEVRSRQGTQWEITRLW